MSRPASVSRASSRPVLVVAAWQPELAPLEAALRRRRARAVVTRVIGVGLVEAAAGAALALRELRPRAVILLGTAGVYPGAKLAPGAAAVSGRVRLVCPSVARGGAYHPAPMPTELEAGPLTSTLSAAGGVPVADVACAVAITRTVAGARLLARQSGAALENLEAFSVGRAATLAGVPFACVLGISNRVGPRAHAEWKRHAATAAMAATAAILRYLVPDPGAARAPRARVKAPTRP